MSGTRKLIQASGGSEIEAPENLSLYMMGLTDFGQTGTGDIKYSADLNAYTTSGDFADSNNGSTVDADGGSYIAIKNNGTCWVWGNNNNGQLGLGDTVNRSSPVQLGTETDFTFVSTSGYHTLFIRGGALYGMGGNAFGNLGTNDNTDRSSPVQIPFSFGTPSYIHAGSYYSTFVIDTNRKLYSCGYNYYGTLGDNSTNNRNALAQIGTGSSWRSVAASSHAVATETNGSLYAWGRKNNGQFGNLGTTSTSSPVQVAAGKVWSEHIALSSNGPTFAIQTNGNLNFMGGSQYYGQGGNQSTSNGSSPVVIAYDVNAVMTDASRTVFRKSNGSLWSVGYGGSGGLADGTWSDRSSPAQIGSSTSWGYPSAGAILDNSNDNIYIWERVGDANGSVENYKTPTLVGSAGEWRTASHGLDHSLGIKTDGTLWVWGKNTDGRLGLGDTTPRSLPVQVGSSTDWTKVYASSQSSFAINSNGDLYVSGGNASGQLGTGNTNDISSFTQLGSDAWLDVACGNNHTVAIKADGTLWTWGDNLLSQLGDGSVTTRLSPGQRNSNTDFVQVGAGQYWSAARRSSGSGWYHAGSSQQNQAGSYIMKNTTFSNVMTSYTFDDMKFGGNHLGGRIGKTIYLWGMDTSGQFGLGSTASYRAPTQISGSWFDFGLSSAGSYLIDYSNNLWVSGSNNNGMLGNGNNVSLSSLTQIGSSIDFWRSGVTPQTQNAAGVFGG